MKPLPLVSMGVFSGVNRTSGSYSGCQSWVSTPGMGPGLFSAAARPPKYPRAHLQPGEVFASCVHTSCADGSASNVRLVAILGRTQSAHCARLAVGVAGRTPGPAWVPTRSPLHPTHGRANTSARLAAPTALLGEKRCDQGAEGSDGAPGGSGWVEKPPQGCSQPGVSKLHGTRWSIT